jgi:octanoyl-[GcvH]:protein N-octanoyltransferase
MATRLGSEEQFYIHDTSTRTLVGDILFPFAYDELMCRKVGDGAAPLVHIWRHEKALVLGLRDRRLPLAEMGMRWLSAQGYELGVRNSGGAAVPLDPGVLNISLILPNVEGKPSFQAGFELMHQLLAETLQRFDVEIEAGEVVGSYCPGNFDLSIDGRKFCGISQRRQHKAYVVQAFVVVEGHAERRSQMVRMFYEMATGEENNQLDSIGELGGVASESYTTAMQTGKEAQLSYPKIRSGSMGSLVSLASGRGVTMRTFALALQQTLQQWGGSTARHPQLPSMDELQKKAAELKQRYDN